MQMGIAGRTRDNWRMDDKMTITVAVVSGTSARFTVVGQLSANYLSCYLSPDFKIFHFMYRTPYCSNAYIRLISAPYYFRLCTFCQGLHNVETTHLPARELNLPTPNENQRHEARL